MGPGPRRRPPVMADVAKMASVSHQTVSRVLNDHLNVSAETRTRVLRAIDLLGYRRNLVSLRIAGRAGVLGAIGYLTEQGVDGIVVVAPQRLTPRHLLDLGHETVWYVGDRSAALLSRPSNRTSGPWAGAASTCSGSRSK